MQFFFVYVLGFLDPFLLSPSTTTTTTISPWTVAINTLSTSYNPTRIASTVRYLLNKTKQNPKNVSRSKAGQSKTYASKNRLRLRKAKKTVDFFFSSAPTIIQHISVGIQITYHPPKKKATHTQLSLLTSAGKLS